MHRKIVILVLLLFVTYLQAYDQETKMKKKFDPTPILKNSLNELGCKGILLGVSENGNIETYSAGTIPNDDHNRPYYIYSISKSFTAVAIMKLCEEQDDFLDKPFSSLLPNPKVPHAITVRQMLNHTSGLSDYFSSSDYKEALKENPTQPWSYEKLMDLGLRNTPLFEAGKGWSYSNPGYALLDELIEEKSGMESYDYVKKVIIDKIGLKNTKPFLNADHNLELLEGDDDSFEGDFRAKYQPGWIATSCYISTVSDVVRFYEALFRGELLRKESMAEMVKTVDVFPNSLEESIPSYGLGLMHFRNSPLGDGYGHGGGGPGYTTYAVHYPDLKGNSVSISLVLNKSLPQTPFGLADEIVRRYIETQTE